MEAEEIFQVAWEEEKWELERVLGCLPKLLESSEWVRVHWIPHTSTCLVWRGHRTFLQEFSNPNFLQKFSSVCRSFSSSHILDFLYWVSRYFPSIVKRIHKIWSWAFWAPSSGVADSSVAFTLNCRGAQRVAEWGIPLEEASNALRAIRDASNSQWALHAPLEIRSSAPDPSMLSPATGRATVWMGVIVYRPWEYDVPNWESAFAMVEKALEPWEPRPHWAKWTALSPSERSKRFPQWETFASLRKELDPEGRFVNPFLGRYFPGTF